MIWGRGARGGEGGPKRVGKRGLRNKSIFPNEVLPPDTTRFVFLVEAVSVGVWVCGCIFYSLFQSVGDECCGASDLDSIVSCTCVRESAPPSLSLFLTVCVSFWVCVSFCVRPYRR